MKKYGKTIFSGNKQVQAFTVLSILALSLWAFIAAAAPGDTTSDADQAANAISCVLCKVASLIFMIVGALAALVIILAGLKWLTSGDDPGARSAAKTAIISAFVGLIIVFIAVYVVSWVVTGLPGMKDLAGKVNPSDWLTGSCDICNEIDSSSSSSSSGSSGGPGAQTCASLCGSKTGTCYTDAPFCQTLNYDVKGSASDCTGGTPVCCCH